MKIDSIAELDRFIRAMEREFGGVPKEVNIVSENIIDQVVDFMRLSKDNKPVSVKYLGVKIIRPNKK
jgi:hypothetical protein